MSRAMVTVRAHSSLTERASIKQGFAGGLAATRSGYRPQAALGEGDGDLSDRRTPSGT